MGLTLNLIHIVDEVEFELQIFFKLNYLQYLTMLSHTPYAGHPDFV